MHQHHLHAHALDQRQILRDVLELAGSDRLTRHGHHEGLAAVHMDVGRDRAEPGHEGEVEDGGHWQWRRGREGAAKFKAR
jgi:hypothetical protein